MQQFNQAPVPLDIGSTKTDLTVVAEAYSPPYNIGEYCSRDGKIYKCKSAVSSGAAWYASNWDEVVIADEIHNGNIRKVDITFTNIDVQTENELYGDTSYVDVSGYNFNEVNALFFEVTAPTKIDAITLTFNGDRVTASATFYYGCPSSVTLSIYVAPIPGLSSSHTQTLHGATGAVFYGLNQKVAKSDIYNGLDQTTAGKVLDARAGSSLNQAITNINNTLIPYSADPAASDMNSITSTAGVPYTGRWAGGSTSNAPINNNQGVYYGFKSSANYETQFAIDNSGYAYIRGKTGGTWGSWSVIALKKDSTDRIKYSDSAAFDVTSSGVTVTVPNNFRGVLYITDSGATQNGEYLVYSTSSGTTGTRTVLAADNFTINISTANKFVLSATSGSRRCYIMSLQGTISIS